MKEATLIATLGKREHYDRFHHLVKEYAVLPETFEIIRDMSAWYKAHDKEVEIDWDSFPAWAFINIHTSWKEEQRRPYEHMVETVKRKTPDVTIVDRFNEVVMAADVQEAAEDALFKGGTGLRERLIEVIDNYDRAAGEGTDRKLVLAPGELFRSLVRTDGAEWRLEELNVRIGPLVRGDNVIVVKRPDVGGTTFMTSEFTHMIKVMPEGSRAVIFSNEEGGDRIEQRLRQSALRMTTMDMWALGEDEVNRLYHEYLDGRDIDVIHDTYMDTKLVEAQLRLKDYSLIGFNTLPEVQLKGKLEDWQKYKRLTKWARGLAEEYAPVVSIWQGDSTADNVEWLSMNQVYGSKTDLQATADVLLLIGYTDTPGCEFERYFSIAKNKLPGGPRTDPKLRKAKFVVDIDTEHGRFESRMT